MDCRWEDAMDNTASDRLRDARRRLPDRLEAVRDEPANEPRGHARSPVPFIIVAELLSEGGDERSDDLTPASTGEADIEDIGHELGDLCERVVRELQEDGSSMFRR